MPDMTESLNMLLDIEDSAEITEKAKIVTRDLVTNNKKATDMSKNVSKYNLSDAEFLREELKYTIMSATNMLEVLSQDLKPGTTARSFECYANLMKAKNEALDKLINLNETEQKLIIKEDELKQNKDKIMLPFGAQVNTQNILNILPGQNGATGANGMAGMSMNPDDLRKALIFARDNAELSEVVDDYSYEQVDNTTPVNP